MMTYKTGDPFMTPSYDEIHNACYELVEVWNTHDLRFDAVAGISRGGLIPGVIISHLLSLPFVTISYSSKEGKGDNKNHNNTLPFIDTKSLLIVDDIADSGKTLREVRNHYVQLDVPDISVYTAVLFYKIQPEKANYTPRFYWRAIPDYSGWVTFPWEK